MLRGLLKSEIGVAPVSEPVPRKRNRKRALVSHLYPAPEPIPRMHARAIINEVQTHAEHVCGTFVPKDELDRFYQELCQREGWQARHWTAVARHLSQITERRRLKRHGRQFRAYKIPRVHA